MVVSYLKKGKGVLKARCEFNPCLIEVGDVLIPLKITNIEGEIVLSEEIIFYIREKNEA